jgi:hypothetical protein
VELECISLGGKLFGNGLCSSGGGGTISVTGLYGFGGQIVWNWTAKVWGVNCVEMNCMVFWGENYVELDCIILGKGQIVWNRTVYIWEGANCVALDCIVLRWQNVWNWTV